MAEPKKDLSADDAKKQAGEAIDNGATKVKLELQDGKWTLTVTP
jgi:hypothetical protein